jgi:hypothetical protein
MSPGRAKGNGVHIWRGVRLYAIILRLGCVRSRSRCELSGDSNRIRRQGRSTHLAAHKMSLIEIASHRIAAWIAWVFAIGIAGYWRYL